MRWTTSYLHTDTCNLVHLYHYPINNISVFVVHLEQPAKKTVWKQDNL